MTKVAIVTGASRGIGKAIALGLAADGFNIAAMGRNLDDLKTVATQASLSENRFLPIAMDLDNPQSIIDAVRSIPRDFGRIDILVNNAGRGGAGTLEVKADTLRSILAVNLTGPFLLLQEVVPLMIAEKHGTIINVASRAGKIGFAGWGAYGASKFGLVGLSESLYRELAPHGIRVTTLCPGWVDTDMAREGGSPLASKEMIQPDDLMKTIRWLLSLSPAACVRDVMIECASDIA